MRTVKLHIHSVADKRGKVKVKGDDCGISMTRKACCAYCEIHMLTLLLFLEVSFFSLVGSLSVCQHYHSMHA